MLITRRFPFVQRSHSEKGSDNIPKKSNIPFVHENMHTMPFCNRYGLQKGRPDIYLVKHCTGNRKWQWCALGSRSLPRQQLSAEHHSFEKNTKLAVHWQISRAEMIHKEYKHLSCETYLLPASPWAFLASCATPLPLSTISTLWFPHSRSHRFYASVIKVLSHFHRGLHRERQHFQFSLAPSDHSPISGSSPLACNFISFEW